MGVKGVEGGATQPMGHWELLRSTPHRGGAQGLVPRGAGEEEAQLGSAYPGRFVQEIGGGGMVSGVHPVHPPQGLHEGVLSPVGGPVGGRDRASPQEEAERHSI